MMNILSTSLLFLVLALLSCGAAHQSSQHNDHVPADIDKACATTQDKDFCVQSLKSSARSKKLGMGELTFLSMEMAQNKSTQINTFISKTRQNEDSLGNGVSDNLSECDEIYDDTTALIENAMSAFFSNSYDEIRKYLKAAINLANRCDKGITDPKAKALMGDNNMVFSKMCENSLAFLDSWQNMPKNT